MTPPQRFHDILTRSVWALVLSPPLIACLALAALTLTHKPAPVNTGDALIDAYLQAVVEQDVELAYHRPISYYGIWKSIDYKVLSDNDWLKLETRFGDDPRYWLLCHERYNNGRTPSKTDKAWFISEIAGVELEPRYRYLEEARERHRTSIVGLLTLLGGYRKAWRLETEKSGNLTDPGSKASYKVRLAYEGQIRKGIDNKHVNAERALLADVIALAPESPLPKYIMAMDEVLRNDTAQARELIHTGNRLAARLNSKNTDLRTSFANPFQVKPDADELIAFWLPSKRHWIGLAGLITTMRQPANALVQEAITKHDCELLQEIHVLSCCIARETGFQNFASRSPIYIGNAVADAAVQVYGHQLTAEQRARIGEIHLLLAEIKVEDKKQRRAQLPGWLSLSWPKIRIQRSILFLAGGQHRATMEYQEAAQQANSWPAYYAKMDELYSKLERFDYTTLSWREDAR